MSTFIQLTVAIPTMKRWSFLKKLVPQLLENDLIQNVLICDETGDDVKEIQKSSFGKHDKLILHTNTKKLGMYANKRKCIELSPTEWVAVLDSDNIFPDLFFETLIQYWQTNGINSKTIYASSHIIRLFLNNSKTEEKTAHFSGMAINKSNWNKILKMNASVFLLNDGNWIGHKSVLETWPTNIPDEQIRATDSILIIKNAIEKGFTYFVVPELTYIHTVHDDSEWLKTERESNYLLGTTNWFI